MTAPQLPEARLREIASGANDFPHQWVKPEDAVAMAAELLAARETIKAQLAAGKALYEATQKLMAERDAARAELAALHARIEQSHNGYQETGKSLGMERPASHLIALGELLTEQVELADSVVRIERDEARAEVERKRREAECLRADLQEIAEGTGCNVPDRAEAKRRIIGLRAEVERVAKQRDELVAAVLHADALRIKSDSLPDDAYDQMDQEIDAAGSELVRIAKAIAAEQPKPAGGA